MCLAQINNLLQQATSWSADRQRFLGRFMMKPLTRRRIAPYSIIRKKGMIRSNRRMRAFIGLDRPYLTFVDRCVCTEPPIAFPEPAVAFAWLRIYLFDAQA